MTKQIHFKNNRAVRSFLPIFLLLLGLWYPKLSFAESYTLSVGENVTISQTAYNGGYIDNVGLADYLDPHLGFTKNYDGSATITVNSYFDYTATVKLVFIERYQSYYNGRNHTLAYTYYKDVSIKCRYQAPEPNKKPTKVILPERIRVNVYSGGDRDYITPILEPNGAKGTSYYWGNDQGTAVFAARTMDDGRCWVTGRSPGIGRVYVVVDDDWDKLYASAVLEVVDPNHLPPNSVFLPSEIEISVNGSSTLTPTLVPENTSTAFTWKSEDESIATVSYGKVTGKKVGTTTIKVTTTNQLTATCTVKVVSRNGKDDEESGDNNTGGSVGGHDYVDLGLSVKWATCNVGANSPEGFGGYYAWGETTEKNSYTWSTYKHCGGSILNVYDIGSDIKGTPYDAAYVNWGSDWRMPTEIEMGELVSKCTFKEETQNGVDGYLVTGPNGSSVFFPTAGVMKDKKEGGCRYWTSTVHSGDYGMSLLITKNKNNVISPSVTSQMRSFGLPIRAVTTASGGTSVEPTSVSLPASKSVNVGESITLTATLSPSNATTKLTWSSDDTSIATVSSSGIVNGVKVGTTKIRVKTSNGKTDYCNVTVENNTVEPTSISLPSSKTVKVGESFTMTYTLTPSNATTTLTWSSDDTSIATVSSSGVVKGVKAGTTKIRVKTSNGKTDYCNVTVETNTVEPTSISLPSSKTVKVGESFTMTYTLTPSNATTTLTWSSDDTSIATVSSSGVVKGIKAGTTKIRVKTANGKTDYCNVTVEANGGDTLNDGDTFTAYTDEGVSIIYKVISSANKTCEVARNRVYSIDNKETTTTKVTIPQTVNGYSVVAIGDGAFYYWQALKSITLPVSIVKIDEDAFYQCKELTSISLPDNVEEIGESAFSNCEKLASINIPNKVKTISYHAFWCCYSLKNITIPNSVTKIGGAAFYSCSSFTSFVLPKSVEVIEEDWITDSRNILQYCKNLKEIIVEDGNKYFDSRDNCNAIVEKTTNTLLAGCQNTKIPNTIISLGAGSFKGAQMTSVNVPNSVTTIGEYAFCGCSNLKSVRLPEGLTRIEEEVFGECSLITSLDFLPKAVQYIGKWAFRSTGITNLRIPDGIVELDEYAFGNTKATSVTIPSSIERIGKSAFMNTAKNATQFISYIENPKDIDESTFHYYQSGYYFTSATLYVPQGCKTKYQQAEGWKKFSKIIEMNKIELKANPSGCEMNKGEKVYLSSSNAKDADIFYTIDGTTPTKSSTKYTSSGVSINENCTLKAIAYKDGYETSDILAETYTIKKEDIRLTITSSGYATFYSSMSAYTLPNDLSAKVVKEVSNGKLTYETIIIIDGNNVNIVPKGVPVMIESNNKQTRTYTLTAVTSNSTYTGTNLLRGSDEPTTTTGEGLHYKLSYGPTGTKWDDVFGWYWGSQNGAPFQIEGHKAWLVIPKNGTRAAGFTVEGDVLDIESLEELSDQPSDLYFDLQGRRISQPTKRGVYIKNGMKVIFK